VLGLLSNLSRTTKIRKKKYNLQQAFIFRASKHLYTARECERELWGRRRGENEIFTKAGKMYVAGFIISSTMPMYVAIGNGDARKKFSAKSDISVACFRKHA